MGKYKFCTRWVPKDLPDLRKQLTRLRRSKNGLSSDVSSALLKREGGFSRQILVVGNEKKSSLGECRDEGAVLTVDAHQTSTENPSTFTAKNSVLETQENFLNGIHGTKDRGSATGLL